MDVVLVRAVVLDVTLTTTPHVFNSPISTVLVMTHGLSITLVGITGIDSVRVAVGSYRVARVLPMAHPVLAIRAVPLALTITVTTVHVQRVVTAVVLFIPVGNVNGDVLAKELRCYQEKE